MDYNFRHPESSYPTENVEEADLSSKEQHCDRSFVASFREETKSILLPEPQIADSITSQGKEINVEVSKDSTWNMFASSGDTEEKKVS